MLYITKLDVTIKNNIPILHDINLTINPGEIHAIMGPNGSGKSTLSKVIVGHPEYTIKHGKIFFMQQDLSLLLPDERAKVGIFMSFQYPIEIPGITNINFLKTSINTIRKAQGKNTMDVIEIINFIKEKSLFLGIHESFLYRNINECFSGGEKKKNEILQMILLQPKLSILDEIDSGLDIDALKKISHVINNYIQSSNCSIIFITHHYNVFNYIKPNYVHVLIQGKIVKSGDISLALEIENKGYNWIKQ